MRSPYAWKLLAIGQLIAALGFLAAGCVAPSQVPKDDPHDDEEALLVRAVFEVLAEENYGVVAVSQDGRRVESNWRSADQGQLRVIVRVSRTSMGLALALKADRAVPATTSADPEAAPSFDIDGVPHRLVEGERQETRAEEARLGRNIQTRWEEKRALARRDAGRAAAAP